MRIEKLQKRWTQSLPVVLGLTLVACGTSRNPTTGQASRSEEPAAVAVETSTATATVKSIDYARRTITVEDANGVSRTYVVDKNVVNFDEIHKGDKIRSTVIEALAVSVRKMGVVPNLGDAVTVSLAPKGAKPGIFVENTERVTAKIESIDTAKGTITFKQPSGAERTMKVAPTIELADLKKGDVVVVRYTNALALYVEKA